MIRPRSFNVYGIDNEQFFKIIDYIDSMIEYVRPLENREGLVKYFEENSKQKFLDRSPNNWQYLSRFGLAELTEMAMKEESENHMTQKNMDFY